MKAQVSIAAVVLVGAVGLAASGHAVPPPDAETAQQGAPHIEQIQDAFRARNAGHCVGKIVIEF